MLCIWFGENKNERLQFDDPKTSFNRQKIIVTWHHSFSLFFLLFLIYIYMTIKIFTLFKFLIITIVVICFNKFD